jgi:hypothetical protein
VALSEHVGKASHVGPFIKTNAPARFAVCDRHILMAFAAVLAIALFWERLTFGGTSLSEALVLGRMGVGSGELLAMAALFSVIFRLGDDDALLSRGELLMIALASCAFAVPSFKAASIPLTIVGLIFLPRRDARLSSSGQLLLAFVFYEWFGRIIFSLASPFVLTVETTLVQAALSIFGEFTRDNLTIRAANGHSIYVETACSAFHNLSFATLVWISLIKLETLEMKRFHWWILAAMAIATIALNTARIALMAQSRSVLVYWHDGTGATIVSLTMLAVILIIFSGGRAFAASR